MHAKQDVLSALTKHSMWNCMTSSKIMLFIYQIQKSYANSYIMSAVKYEWFHQW
jgi:hypothetical protein